VRELLGPIYGRSIESKRQIGGGSVISAARLASKQTSKKFAFRFEESKSMLDELTA
jgi:hypothetical protein